jgi:hypothetical protein
MVTKLKHAFIAGNMLLLIMFTFLLHVSELYSFGPRMLSATEKEEFAKEIASYSNSNLYEYLISHDWHQNEKKKLVLEALFTRSHKNDVEANNFVSKYLVELFNHVEEKDDPFDEELYTIAYIIKAKVESEGNEAEFVKNLISLTEKNDKRLHHIAKWQLLNIFSDEAIEFLNKTEQGRLSVQSKLLQQECKGKSLDEILKLCFNYTRSYFGNENKVDDTKFSAVESYLKICLTYSNLNDSSNQLFENEINYSIYNIKYSEFLNELKKYQIETFQNRNEQNKRNEEEMMKRNEESQKKQKKYNPNPVLNEPKKPRFTRPEDRGVSFKDTTQSVLIERLKNSTDKVELRKVTQVLGNREIAGKISLSDEEKKVVYDATVRFLNYQDSSKVDTREEGRFYIHRLWRLAVPALLDNLHNPNIRKKELAAKCLLFMKNEEIVQKIIELAEKEKDPEMKKKLVFVLSKVDKIESTIVPERKSIDEEESKVLFEKLVKPALMRLEKK